jgi:glycosyltransferase involved in cell wall biosynthesis
MADILFLEPFYGGSHKYFADGLMRHSKHSIRLLSLPGRFWKWRMESAGLAFTQQINSQKIEKPDFILVTNLMDLTQFKGLAGWHEIPHILYVHENQLDYPLSPGEKRDFHYVWKDYMNFLTADRLIFNSNYNLESFLAKFKEFTARLPDTKPGDPSEEFRAKSIVIPPGCQMIKTAKYDDVHCDTSDTGYIDSAGATLPPVILWNQRWEHDKNPEAFFAFLKELQTRKIAFKLILMGESYKDSPDCFANARENFKVELLHYGYAESREEYEAWLQKSDFVISTAMQENFGISVVEAMSAGAIPLLPERLAYPEVLPSEFHARCLYSDKVDMIEKFRLLLHSDTRKTLSNKIRLAVSQYAWPEIAARFDLDIEKFQEKWTKKK